MIETCAGFGLLSQSVSGEDLIFSTLRLRSGRQIKSLPFRTGFAIKIRS